MCVKEKKQHFGIFGKTIFSDLIEIPNQVPFDYMHLVLQGHTKWLLNKYFAEKSSECFIGIIGY